MEQNANHNFPHMAQKRVTFIPPNSTLLQEKLVNYIMRRGQKATARCIVEDCFAELQKKGHMNPNKLLEKAIETVMPSLEIRPKRIGGAIYQIPVEVPPKRQLALALRWLIAGAKARKGMPMGKKLALEMIEASQDQGHAAKKKADLHKMAQANKAFAHFARY